MQILRRGASIELATREAWLAIELTWMDVEGCRGDYAIVIFARR
jgi:hypothetical protein